MATTDEITRAANRLQRVFSGELPRAVYAPELGAGATNAAHAAQIVRERLPQDKDLICQEFLKHWRQP